MSTITRLASQAARASLYSNRRYMATAAAAQPNDSIQKLFLDKVKEFKTTNKGLDEEHSKLLDGEMLRLKRVYQIDDVNQLGQLNYKFGDEVDVSLRDLDESKELRRKISSGEYLKELAAAAKPVKSELLASIPDPYHDEYHFAPNNKPDTSLMEPYAGWKDWGTSTEPIDVQKLEIHHESEDYKLTSEKMTPHQLQRDLRVMFGPNMPTIHDEDAPERDVKNFPRQYQPLDTPGCRHHIIPESWFQALYPKTGASGPYALFAGMGTFLFSKEWIPFEHEFLSGMSMIVILSTITIKWGPILLAKGRLIEKKRDKFWDDWQQNHIDYLEEVKNRYKSETNKNSLIDQVYEVREEDINVQLAKEHRSRLKQVFDDTKRRLNYLVSVADTQRSIVQQNMVNWVIANAVKSIGPKQEGEVLDSCISNLKHLSTKHANAI